MKPHKHAELIKAWADGAEIEVLSDNEWHLCTTPIWDANWRYRIKPEPKLDDEITRLIKQRDSYHGWADRLANAISEHFDYDIGEHSSENCPWTNAMVCIESPQPIKPEPKPDVVRYAQVGGALIFREDKYNYDNIKLTFDGETGELKSVEVLK